MEKIEKLEDMKLAERILANILKNSTGDSGKNRGWFSFLACSVGYLRDSIKRMENE